LRFFHKKSGLGGLKFKVKFYVNKIVIALVAQTFTNSKLLPDVARPVFRPAFRPGFSILPKKVARAKKVFALAQQNFEKKSPSSPWPSEIFQFADLWFP
jgi:hypothetical protein